MTTFIKATEIFTGICQGSLLMMTMTRSTFIKVMEMLTGTGTRVRLEGLTVVIGGISFLRMIIYHNRRQRYFFPVVFFQDKQSTSLCILIGFITAIGHLGQDKE